MSSFDRIQRSMNIWVECFAGMEQKIQKLLMRRQKREGLNMNAREYYRAILRKKMNAAVMVDNLKNMNYRSKISKLVKRVDSDQQGFNPFNSLLQDLRMRKDKHDEDMQD